MKRWRQTDRWTGEMGSGDGCFRSGRWGLVRVFSGYLLASRPTRLFARSVPRGLLQLSAITHRHGRQLPSPVIRLYGLQPPTHTCTHAPCTHTHAHTCAHMLLPSLILQDVCCSAVQPPHPLHLPSAVFAFSLTLIDLFEEWKRAGICCVLLFLLAFSCFCFFFVLMLRSARSLSLHLLLWCQHFSRRLHVVHAGLTPVNPRLTGLVFFIDTSVQLWD